jgi:hypothetical protein
MKTKKLKTEKLSFKGITTALSRNELREVMAGGCSSQPGGPGGSGSCDSYLNPCSQPFAVECCPGVQCIGGNPSDNQFGFCAS